MVLPLGVLQGAANNSSQKKKKKKLGCNEILHRTSEMQDLVNKVMNLWVP
jgi:hypothetical protein